MSDFLAEGIHDGIPASVYHADPCPSPSLSSSAAADLLARSPAHVRLHHPRFRTADGSRPADDETPAMAFGSVVHELALGKGGGFAVWTEETWRGKAAAEFRDSAVRAGQTPIKQADFDRAQAVVAAMRTQLDAMGLGYVLTEGKSEQVAVWKSGGQYCRAMFDRWLPERREIWDIKTTARSAHPDQIARLIPSMDYHTRSEFYLMGAEALTGLPSRAGGLGYQFLFVETSAPYCVTPCFLDLSLREHGRKRAQEAINIWSRCMETDNWPGYVSAPAEIAAPGWVNFEIEDSEITTTEGRIA